MVHRTSLATLIAALLLCGTADLISAQRNRVAAIDTEERRLLTGHVHGLATPENDQGRAESSLELRSMTLVLKPSAEQQADLDAFLARQQDPSSPDYHRWLTPEQYADRFGFSADDLSRIATWLESQNLTVISVARGRNAILFSGPVRQVEKAFRTEIHRYKVNGELHFANSTDPSIPAALTGLVTAIHGLNDFRPQARLVRKATSNYTSGVTGNHYLAPDDVAAIYDVKPLYNSGVDGAGQKIAIVGQSRINLDDIRQFRAA
jgi:subtilase family serine protease